MPPPAAPFRVYDLFDLKIEGEASKKYSAAASGAETTKREKALWQREICQGNSLPEGEIVAVIIATSFIGIIINIILTDSTIISTAPLRSAVASRVILVL